MLTEIVDVTMHITEFENSAQKNMQKAENPSSFRSQLENDWGTY